MKVRFIFEGQIYSKNKSSFKSILKKHGLKWKGSMREFIWIGERDKIVAEFERDPERDVTLSATLTWTGKRKTDFLRELESWAREVGGKLEAPSDTRDLSMIEKELKFWDSLHKPDEERLRSRGCPESWIQRDLREWRNKRRKKKKELIEKYG